MSIRKGMEMVIERKRKIRKKLLQKIAAKGIANINSYDSLDLSSAASKGLKDNLSASFSTGLQSSWMLSNVPSKG